MLRKISLVLLALLIALSSTSCSSNQTWLSSRIIKNTTGLESHSTIFVDEEADVMYLLYSIGSQSGLTMMLNTEGKPKLSNDTEYKTRAINSSSKILVDDENGVLYFFGIMNGESGLVAMYDENGMPRLEKDTQYNVTKIESFGTNEYSGSYYKILVDDEEGVMYLVCKHLGYIGITMMVNPDGSPKLNNDTKYETVSIGKNAKICVDDESNIMYLVYSKTFTRGVTSPLAGSIASDYLEGDIVMMANADGTPRFSNDTEYETSIFELHRGYNDSLCMGTDIETGVMYMFYRCTANGGGLTTVMKEDGFPKTE